jgi:hypothetical protein
MMKSLKALKEVFCSKIVGIKLEDLNVQFFHSNQWKQVVNDKSVYEEIKQQFRSGEIRFRHEGFSYSKLISVSCLCRYLLFFCYNSSSCYKWCRVGALRT